jgi:hypothetical protein
MSVPNAIMFQFLRGETLRARTFGHPVRSRLISTPWAHGFACVASKPSRWNRLAFIGFRSSSCLTKHGFEVKLVDPRQMKNIPGRRTDVLD